MKILTSVDLTIWWREKIAERICYFGPFWPHWGKCDCFFYMFSYCSVAGEETWDLAGLGEGRRKQKLVLILRGLRVCLRVRAERERVGNKQIKQKTISASFLGVHVPQHFNFFYYMLRLLYLIWVQKFKIKKQPALWLISRSSVGREGADRLISTPVFR